MTKFEEKAIHTKLYKEGFVKIESELNSEQDLSKIRFEYKHKDRTYNESITLFKSYEKITTSNYTNSLIEKKNFSSSFVKYFDSLQKEGRGIDSQDVLTMTEFIFQQMQEREKKEISIFNKGSVKRKIKQEIEKMVEIGIGPFDILNDIITHKNFI